MAKIDSGKRGGFHPKTDISAPKPQPEALPSPDHAPQSATAGGVRQTTLTTQQIIQMRPALGNRAATRMLATQRQAATSVQRLPDPLQGSMEKVFGDSLAEVQVHTDAHADQIAQNAKSDATTIDNAIYFKQGAYRPGTADGNALIAREVAHIQRAKLTGSPA
jgi:hypothetical protein